MGRLNRQHKLDLDDLILNCLESNTFLTTKQITSYLGTIARDSGREPWVEGTIRYHLDDLIERGKVKHQEQGYLIDRGWKEGQPKAFVLVNVAKPKQIGEKKNTQMKFVEEIRDGFRSGVHKNLSLISVDIVMGAEFDVVVQVYSDHLHFIGLFVKEYLSTSELVTNTRTIMVWPTETGSLKLS